MSFGGVIPDWILSVTAAATLFVVMFDLGIAIVPVEFRWVIARPALLARALFCVLLAVPAIAWLVARVFDLPRNAEIGMMLMAIAPGAPVALRRSLDAGGHRAFAPALQIVLAITAIVSMPLWIAGFDEYYAGDAAIDPRHLARQVFYAQLLPLALGMAARKLLPVYSVRVEPQLRRLGSILLALLLILALIDIWHTVVGAGLRVAIAIVVTTLLALAVGHTLGGPEPATRTATAISSAARNAGMALLVATLNKAAPAILGAVLAYFVVAAFTIIPYGIWRVRAARSAAARAPPG
jgi:BASS family bile acid:Na+ symporter